MAQAYENVFYWRRVGCLLFWLTFWGHRFRSKRLAALALLEYQDDVKRKGFERMMCLYAFSVTDVSRIKMGIMMILIMSNINDSLLIDDSLQQLGVML